MTRTPACNLVDRPTLRSFETRTSALALSASAAGVPSSISRSNGGDNNVADAVGLLVDGDAGDAIVLLVVVVEIVPPP